MMVIPEQYRSINVVKYIVGRGERKKWKKCHKFIFASLPHGKAKGEKSFELKTLDNKQQS
jgi:hypothetical protein